MAEVGKYRRRVSLINNQQGRDSYGVWYSDPITHITCFAYRDQIKSNSANVQYAMSYEIGFKYEIWYNSGVVIDSNMILRDDNKDYKIVSIEVTGDKKVKWVLICQRKEK
jgi:hypothetical protein